MTRYEGSRSVYVAEFTLYVKPGHFSEVADLYSDFAAEFLVTHDALESVLVVGDEASGLVRGIGVWADRESADAVNSNPEFAAFNDAINPLLARPAERAELSLLHLFART
jgi:quinol monooxygenase YgiN